MNPAMAAATEFGFDFVETLIVAMVEPLVVR
jgi:hypothetical protein